jgi:hypothetical protein
VQLVDNTVLYSQGKTSQYSLILSLFIFTAYLIVTSVIKSGIKQTGSNIQIIIYVLYIAQQVQFASRYQPMNKLKEMDLYLNATCVQLLTFVCLVMGPTLPITQWICPVTIVYSFSYWGIYIMGKQSNGGVQEVLVKFVTYALLSVFVALVHQG